MKNTKIQYVPMSETSATIGNQKTKVFAEKYDFANWLAVITMMIMIMIMIMMIMIMMMAMMIMMIMAISHGNFL